MRPDSFRPSAFQGRAAVARRDISPPPGIYARNWGAAVSPMAQGIHQSLYITALVVVDEGPSASPFIILSLDLGWWRSKIEEEAFARIPVELGLDPARFVVALSHTHSGPVFCPGESNLPGGDKIVPYLDLLCSRATDAIREALASTRPVVIEAAAARCSLATNRDLREEEKDRYLVGWNPAAPADDLLLLARVTDAGGKVLATLVNYACHPTILAWDNVLISPDYVGTLTRVVEQDTGAPCLFLQGASGELAPALQYVGDPKIAEQAGRCAGHAALSALHSMFSPGRELAYAGVVESGAPLAIWKTQPCANIPDAAKSAAPVIDLPIKPGLPTLDEIDADFKRSRDPAIQERLRRLRLVRESLGNDTSYPLLHRVWRLGNLFFVAIPNEAYSILQQELRKVVAPHPLFVITVANGGRGYLCPRELYKKQIYSANQSPFAAGSLELVIERLSNDLRLLAAS